MGKTRIFLLAFLIAALFAAFLIYGAGAINPTSVMDDSALSSNAPMDEPKDKPKVELGPRDVIEAYFDRMYTTYITNEPEDFSDLLDMSQEVNQNMVTWQNMLLQRRRLIAENNLAYVETERFDYQINYAEQADDERMEFWSRYGQGEGGDELFIHFSITGEKGEAYPPLMAMNSFHTMRLKEIDGDWKITFHYFPGSVRKYYRTNTLVLPSDEEYLKQLSAEFAPIKAPAGDAVIPIGAKPYNAQRTALYAEKFTEVGNPEFYDIGDWMGNCQNFISQSVWYGFSKDGAEPSVNRRDNMTNAWFAGGGGGSPAWENVGHFWNYAVSGGTMKSTILEGAAELELGDIIQTRSAALLDASDTGFSHSLIVTDEETLKLAQNSPACFVYYSDVLGVETRMIRPVYLIA